MKDIDRDRFMTPEEAVEYGIVDAIMETRAPAGGGNGIGLGT
jgi:ATP-dependent Clp protease protease subunit